MCWHVNKYGSIHSFIIFILLTVPPFIGYHIFYSKHHSTATFKTSFTDVLSLNDSKQCSYNKILRFISSEGIPQKCMHHSTEYFPSRIEIDWFDATITVEHDKYCQFASRWKNMFADLLNSIATRNYSSPHFSVFIHSYKCKNNITKKIRTVIEPLVGILRHPYALCDEQYLTSREYLAIDTRNIALQTGKHMYFDLGASTWQTGGGGSSQDFMFTNYLAHNVTFSRFLLWEATPMQPETIFASLPRKMHPVYQFFNIPASADSLDPANPLNILKQIAHVDDYVVIKIDIDNFSLENQFLRQILNDSDLQAKIDDLYFEHHFNFKPMVECCWGKSADSSASLHDAYRLIYKLRSLGIHAHGWP